MGSHDQFILSENVELGLDERGGNGLFFLEAMKVKNLTTVLDSKESQSKHLELTFVVSLICDETNHFIHFIPSRVVPASSVARHQPCSCSRSASDQVHSNQRLLFGGRTSVSAALEGAEERLSLAIGLDPNLSFHSKCGLLLSAS